MKWIPIFVLNATISAIIFAIVWWLSVMSSRRKVNKKSSGSGRKLGQFLLDLAESNPEFREVLEKALESDGQETVEGDKDARTLEAATDEVADAHDEAVTDPQEQYELGYRQLLEKDFEQAVKHFTNALAHQEGDLQMHLAYYARGVAYDDLEEFANSLRDLTRSIEIKPSFFAHFSRGKVHVRMKDWHAGLADFIIATELAPDDFRSLNAAAWMLASSPIDSDRNGALATKHATRACELSSYQDRICLDTLASAFAESGDFAKAISWQIRAREILVEEMDDADLPDTIDIGLDVVKYDAKLSLFRSGKPFREEVAADE